MFKTYGDNRSVEEVEEFDVSEHNTIPFKNIDLSGYTTADIVGLIDGDWLAYSVCCTLSEDDEMYVAKGRINQKIENFVRESGCTKLIIFCGSTGNFRLDLPLPKRINTKADNSGRYKDNRRDVEAPPYLNEIKHWMMKKNTSWWAVNLESDDCIVISSVELTRRRIRNYIYAIDKDFNQIHGGGLAIVGHQEKPTLFKDTPENRLGWLEIVPRTMVRKDGSMYTVNDIRGHGDKFLVYQCLTEDTADNYSCKNFLNNNFGAGSFGDIKAVKYINQATTREELWSLYLKRFTDALPQEFEYEAWDGCIIKATPFSIADLYFKCACMIREEGVLPSLRDYLVGVKCG